MPCEELEADGDSGHGGQTEDLDGDEDDGYDEVIYPVDFRTAGHIVDDEMHRIMYAHAPSPSMIILYAYRSAKGSQLWRLAYA